MTLVGVNQTITDPAFSKSPSVLPMSASSCSKTDKIIFFFIYFLKRSGRLACLKVMKAALNLISRLVKINNIVVIWNISTTWYFTVAKLRPLWNHPIPDWPHFRNLNWQAEQGVAEVPPFSAALQFQTGVSKKNQFSINFNLRTT